MRKGIIGLVGLQGVGKSSGLMALYFKALANHGDNSEVKKTAKNNTPPSEDILHFKWRRQQDLFESLLNGTHEFSSEFCREYSARLLGQFISRFQSSPILQSKLKEIAKHPETLNLDWAQKELGKQIMNRLRQTVLLEMFLKKKLILIDTPDYSQTDRRLMTKDLEEIHWLWNNITAFKTEANIVLAIQKEMFHGHFFLDKMMKVELEPLRPEQMLEAYVRRFKVTEPFTKDALLALARMSRGIFRRFLRYLTLTLNLWEPQPEPRMQVDAEMVKEAISTERLVEDMEFELSRVFPKHSDLQLQAIRVLLRLEEKTPVEQNALAEDLEIKPYALSRLLTKLELNRYVTRRHVGKDKIVSLPAR